jgi:hypothetical protein
MFSTLVETQGSMGVTAKGNFTPDELRFLGLCEQGKLYEEMQAMIEDTPMRMPRARFKEFFFGTVFFCPNRVYSPLQRMFKAMFTEEFPGVSRLIARLKRKDHQFLACLMQHYEACYMMAGVCPRLMKGRPEAPLLTIHDSVLTTDSGGGLSRGHY